MPAVFSGVLRSKTPKGQTAAGMEAGCVNSRVFARQKPKAQKWHGDRIFWSFAEQNSERSNRGRHGSRLCEFLGFCLAKTQSSKMARRPFLSSARDRAEIPEAPAGTAGAEELERKPGFLRQGAKNAPEFKNKTKAMDGFGTIGAFRWFNSRRPGGRIDFEIPPWYMNA
jgi:hypothetical protein